MSDLLIQGPPAILVNGSNPDNKPKASHQHTASALKKKVRAQKHVTIQPLSRILRGASDYVLALRDGLTTSEREDQRRVEERMEYLAQRMQNATTMKEWEAAAKELDTLEGNDEWKLDPTTGDYNPDFIESKLKELDAARASGDIRLMLHLVRTALTRDLGGMGNIDLYRHSYTGTKKLIERYVDSAVKMIQSLVDKSAYSLPTNMEPKDLLEGVLYARQSFGRSALLLSGGATFGMSHIGVLKALYESRLLPRIISGASAGSIVCSVLCTRKDEEIPELIEQFPYGDLGVFEGENDGLSDNIRRLLTEGSWADISNLTRVMRSLLGDLTFQEAYNRTRRICNICVSSASIYELPRLLNYVTAPNVMIWSAVAASCSVPLVFQAAPLLVKDPATGAHVPWNPVPQAWIDGSVDNDLPMTRLAEMFNVNHFIVSQVNPHVVPFLSKDDGLYPGKNPGRLRQQKATQDNGEWIHTLTALAKDEALHRLQFLTELGVFPNLFTKLRCILSQKYSGDITILPEIAVQDLPRILKNPTSEFMLRNCLIGERATWPKLSRIKDRCAIELALDHAVHALRARVVFSKSQIDLRRWAGAETTNKNRGISVSSGTSGSSKNTRGHSRHSSSGSASEDYQSLRRRSSGSSIQLLAARHRKALQAPEDMLTDDESEEDERLEMTSRRSNRTGRNASISKPRLRRSAKSQSHMREERPWHSHDHQHYHDHSFLGHSDEMHSSPGDTVVVPVYDFSKPLSPPRSTSNALSHEGSDSAVMLDDSTAEDLGKGSPARVEIMDCETVREVEVGLSRSNSDADGDVDSDFDPYQESAAESEQAGADVHGITA